MDLRLKFDIQSINYNERTCIIVVEIASNHNKISMGIVVDSVSEVLNIKGTDIEDTPNFGSRLDTAYILGMAKIGQGIKILLDIDKVINATEMEELSAA